MNNKALNPQGISPGLLADHIARPRNVGRVTQGWRGLATVNNPATGDALSFSLRIENGRITEARFRSFGNPVLRGCASFVAETASGQMLDDVVRDVTLEAVARTLQVPPPHLYCVRMVIATMLEAVLRHDGRYGIAAKEVGS